MPTGNTLDAETFRHRHLLLCWILALHVPSLFAFGVWQGYGVAHSAVEVITPAVCLILARLARNRRVAAFFVTAGLVFCSSALVHLSGGTIEAHFHFFILIGLIGLYQDWVPFLWNVAFTVLSHGLGSSIAADLMFNHDAAQNRPWSWAVIHGVSVLAGCVGVIIFWKNTEIEQERNTRLVAELSEAEVAAAQAEAARRQSVSELLVNLARRSQSLLDRQLGLIAELEQRERQPEALSELFQLDHLATRIRRNAESLLVLSGDEPPRRWGRPVPLAEVVRAAAAEVEDYGRVEVMVNDHLDVAGHVVADLAHLLAELIENATTFSPPSTEVRVRSHLAPAEWSTFVVSVEDTGIGMPESEMRAANGLLANPPDIDLGRSTLGLHVVSRLAKRYGLQVKLANTPGGGVTALVTLPNDIVAERRPAPAAAPAPPPSPPEPLGSGLRAVPPSPIRTIPDTEPIVRGATLDVPAAAPPLRAVRSVPTAGSNGHSSAQPLPTRRPAPPPAPRLAPPTPSPDAGSPASGTPASGSPGSGSPASGTPASGAPGSGPAEAGSSGSSGPSPSSPPFSGPSSPPASDAPAPRSPGPGAGAPLPTTADGLVRRVPGAGLGALRRATGSGAGANGGDGAPAQRTGHDRERMRSMLSRFQASQRAGRAAAERPADARTPEEEP